METLTYELQTNIIRKILNISDVDFLEEIQKLLMSNENVKVLSEFEKEFITDSKNEINNGNFHSNDEVFNELRTWLNEK